MIIPIRIRHNEPIDQVRWHVQMQVAAKNDPEFATPLVARDSSVDAANWYARVDEHGVDGVVEPLPVDGVLTTKSEQFSEAAAAAFAVLTQAEVAALPGAGLQVWVRARQSSTQGQTWGQWSTQPQLVIVEPAPETWTAEQRDQVIADLGVVVNDLGDVANAVEAGFTAVDEKLDDLTSGVAGVGDAVAGVDDKVVALDAKLTTLSEDIAVSSIATATIKDLQLTDKKNLTLRQGQAYTVATGTALQLVLEGLPEDVLTDGTVAYLRLEPRHGYRGAAESYVASLSDGGDGNTIATFEITSEQTAAMAPSFRGRLWQVDVLLEGDAALKLTPVAGFATVERQATA